jgi:peptidase E
MSASGRPTIAALGGGGFSMEPDNLALDRYLLTLTGVENPRVLFLNAAAGDSYEYVAKFFSAYTSLACRPSWLPLYRRDGSDPAERILNSDLVFVGGGNTANMLAIWGVHGVDVALRTAWERGVVLSGVSAGAICWFEQGSTDSFGPGMAALDGLGLLPGSFCPHYDGEAARRPRLNEMVSTGEMASGYAADDGVAFVFEGRELVDVVASRPDAQGHRVDLVDGEAVESVLAAKAVFS